MCSSDLEIDTAFSAFVRERPDALFIGPDPFFNNRRKQLVLQAVRHGLPAGYASRDGATAWPLAAHAQQATMSMIGFLGRRDTVKLCGGENERAATSFRTFG